jgi:hypothetical protein
MDLEGTAINISWWVILNCILNFKAWIGTVYWDCLLGPSIGSVYWDCLLVLSTGNVYLRIRSYDKQYS